MERKTHWEEVYARQAWTDVSWYQPTPRLSWQLIRQADTDSESRIIDVGGGSSTLVDTLVGAGYRNVTVLDLSASALDAARQRLGENAERVTWIEGDITQTDLPARHYDVWHDRAVFHFLTDPTDRALYIAALRRALRPGGHVIVATFAEDGPTRCSGLEVQRYSGESLHAEFGDRFRLVQSLREEHLTPAGKAQAFVYCYCRLV